MCGGGGGFFGGVASVLTGGISDVLQGDKLGEGLLGEKGGDLFQDFVLSTGTAGLSDAYKGYKKYKETGDIWAGADRLVDPGGIVDYATRKVGSWLPDEIRNAAPALGTAIGSAIYPVAGTAAGYGIGSKIKGGEDEYNYKGDFIRAGTAAALTYLGQAAGQLASNATSTPTGMNPYNSYIMGGNNAAAGNLAYGTPSNLGTFTGTAGTYFSAAPELSLSSLAPLNSYMAGGGDLPLASGDSLKTYTGNDYGEYIAAKKDFSPTMTDRLLDAAKKTGNKQLMKALSGSLLSSPSIAAENYNLLSSYLAPDYQTTGNTWTIPEEEEKKEAIKKVIQQKVQDNNDIKKKMENKEFQPWLEKWREPYHKYATSYIEDEQTKNYLKPKQFLNDFL